MYPDFEQLLSSLNAEGVAYLVVGGYAVGEHAQPRATKDLDIFIGPDPDNAAAVWRARAKFGAPVGQITPQDLVEAGSIFRVGTPPIAVDILRDIDGADFQEAFSRRVLITVNQQTGLQAPFISAEDLIANKLAAGRATDLGDVEALRLAAAERRKLSFCGMEEAFCVMTKP
jgi:hypothetical protein